MLSDSQWEKLFPSSRDPPDSNTFDITLLHLLLREICGLSAPSTGWHNMPSDSDTSHEANIVRIKCFRNELCHGVSTGISNPEFEDKWKKVSKALEDLGFDAVEITRLKNEAIEHDTQRRVEDEVKKWKFDFEPRVESLEQDVQTLKGEICSIQQSISGEANRELTSCLPDEIQVAETIEAGQVAAVVITGGPEFDKGTANNADLAAIHDASNLETLTIKLQPKSETKDVSLFDATQAMKGNINVELQSIINISSPMGTNFDMNHKKITNLPKSANDTDKKTTKKYVDEMYIKPSQLKTNILKYVMDNVNEISSDGNVIVSEIDDLPESIHIYNKKVIYLKLVKEGNNYRSRIGFNLYQLQNSNQEDTYYTVCIEWLTKDYNIWPKIELSFDTLGDVIILHSTTNKHTLKDLCYTRSIVQIKILSSLSPLIYLLNTVHIDNVNVTYPPEYSFIQCIIYGVEGIAYDINPGIYDFIQSYTIENNKMNMDLNMNHHTIINLPSLKSRFFITGVYDKKLDPVYTLFSGQQELLFPINCKVIKCCIKIIDNLETYPPIFILVNNSLGEGTSSEYQSYDMDVILLEGNLFHVKVYNNQHQVPPVTKCLVSVLLETF